MKVPSCVRLLSCQNVVYSFTIRSLSTPYYCLSPTFSFHLPSCFSSSPVQKYLSPILSRLSSLAFVTSRAREIQTGLRQRNESSVRLCIRLKGSIVSTALNCIQQLTELFYYLVFFNGCNLGVLTERRHKVQQTKGQET